MADHFVYSGAGGLNDGTSWTDAKTTLRSLSFNDEDTVYIDYRHVEPATAAVWNLNGAGTDADILTTIISVDSADLGGGADNNAAYRRGALLQTSSGSYNITVGAAKQNVLVYGCVFTPGGAVGQSTDSVVAFHDCDFNITTEIASQVNAALLIYGGTWQAQATTSIFVRAYTASRIECTGVTIDYNSLTMTSDAIGGAAGDKSNVKIVGSDLSGFDEIHNFNGTSPNNGSGFIELYKCKLPATLSTSAGTHYNWGITCYDCDTATTALAIAHKDTAGTITDERTLVRTATTDGTTGYSLKFVSTAKAAKTRPLRFHLADVVVSSATATLTVEIMEEGAGSSFQTNDFWIEVLAPGATAPTGVYGTTKAPQISRETALTSSAESWSGSPTTPTEYSCSITLGTDTAAASAGVVSVWANFAPGAAKTIYVDPFIDVT